MYPQLEMQIHVISAHPRDSSLLLYPSPWNIFYNNMCWLLQLFNAAIPTVVIIAEALQRDGLASNKGKRLKPFLLTSFIVSKLIRMTYRLKDATEVKISTVNSKKDDEGRFFEKAKVGLFALAAGLSLIYYSQFQLLFTRNSFFLSNFYTVSQIQIVLGKAEKLEKAIVATTAPKDTSDTDMKAWRAVRWELNFRSLLLHIFFPVDVGAAANMTM